MATCKFSCCTAGDWRAPPWRARGRCRGGEPGREGKMAAAERSRSPVPGGSPVPACMFAPEPGSPGGRPRGVAAACPLRAAFGGEDGEALNGEPEIDLTSKVGPVGGRAAASAVAPPGPRCSPPCRSAVCRGLPPEPDRSPDLWRARGRGPPASAGTGGSPECPPPAPA